MIPKIKVINAGGYDPALGPRHQANHEPTLEHKIADELETREVSTHLGNVLEYRWKCSCTQAGRWQRNARHSRACGVEHVADTLRGRDVAHAIEVETDAEAKLFRWTCSCGVPPGEWKIREVQARQGGTKHVAHMGRLRS